MHNPALTPEETFRNALVDFYKEKCKVEGDVCPIKDLLTSPSKDFESAYESVFGEEVIDKGCYVKDCRLHTAFLGLKAKHEGLAALSTELLNIRQSAALELFMDSLQNQ